MYERKDWELKVSLQFLYSGGKPFWQHWLLDRRKKSEWTLLSKPIVMTDGLRVLTDVQMLDLYIIEPLVNFHHNFNSIHSAKLYCSKSTCQWKTELYIPYTLGTFQYQKWAFHNYGLNKNCVLPLACVLTYIMWIVNSYLATCNKNCTKFWTM